MDRAASAKAGKGASAKAGKGASAEAGEGAPAEAGEGGVERVRVVASGEAPTQAPGEGWWVRRVEGADCGALLERAARGSPEATTGRRTARSTPFPPSQP
jgi:hypothetical protein